MRKWTYFWCLQRVDRTSLVAEMVNSLPAMQETWVQSLGREDHLEKEMATHSSTLAWKSHGWRSLVGYSPQGGKESDRTERLTLLLPESRYSSYSSVDLPRQASLSSNDPPALCIQLYWSWQYLYRGNSKGQQPWREIGKRGIWGEIK